MVALLLTGAAIAQKSSGIRYGIKAGINFANISLSGSAVEDEDKDHLKSWTSFQIGGLVDIPVGTSFSIQPGLTLTGKGNKTEYEDSGDEFKLRANILYLEIPVNAVIKFGGLYLGAGPYASLALSGKNKGEMTIAGVTEKVDDDIEFGNSDDELRRTDFGVNVLGGYQLSNGLNFGANYGLGLNNLTDDDEYKAKNRVFSVTVGFRF